MSIVNADPKGSLKSPPVQLHCMFLDHLKECRLLMETVDSPLWWSTCNSSPCSVSQIQTFPLPPLIIAKPSWAKATGGDVRSDLASHGRACNRRRVSKLWISNEFETPYMAASDPLGANARDKLY